MGEEAAPEALALAGICARYAHVPVSRERASGADAAAPRAVEDVSLSVRAGEIAVVLGANGAGKSTLLRVACGLLTPEAGTVHLGGRDIATLERRDIARAVALVAQDERVPEGFTVREVVAMGRAPHQDGWQHESRDDRAAIDLALERSRLTALAGRRVDMLSGGEQRRVAMARAMAQGAPVLALDEPAAFLDVRYQLELHDRLLDLARGGVACIVAMHDLDAAARVASHVTLLRAGRVVAAGPPGDVMIPSRLAETFDAELDVLVHEGTGARVFVPLRAKETRARS